MNLTQRLLQSKALPQRGVCTVAFSGGADSTALLLCLYELQETLGISLRAVHVHHGIRGSEADRDAAFCRSFCEARDIPFRCMYVDVPQYAAQHHLSEETAARRLRYAALQEAAQEGEIATAHHAADNAETMLFHLIRGSGTRGLCGIPARSGRIIRPLLCAEKPEILAFLAERAQPYMTDSTNFSDNSTRNRIRRKIIPLLEAENPAFLRHAVRTAEMLSEDEACLDAVAADAVARSRRDAAGGLHAPHGLPRPIRMRIYMRRFAELGIDPSYELMQQIDAAVMCGRGKVTIGSGVYAQVSKQMLYIGQLYEPLAQTLSLRMGENRLFPHKICIAETYAAAALSRTRHRNDMRYTLDPDKIIGRPQFRPWRTDDRILLERQAHSVSVRKRIQSNVPEPERRNVYALYDDEGCIFCESVGVAKRVCPDADSVRILTLDIRPTGDAAHRRHSSAGTDKRRME